MGVSGQLVALDALLLEEESPGTHWTDAGQAPELVWMWWPVML